MFWTSPSGVYGKVIKKVFFFPFSVLNFRDDTILDIHQHDKTTLIPIYNCSTYPPHYFLFYYYFLITTN